MNQKRNKFISDPLYLPIHKLGKLVGFEKIYFEVASNIPSSIGDATYFTIKYYNDTEKIVGYFRFKYDEDYFYAVYYFHHLYMYIFDQHQLDVIDEWMHSLSSNSNKTNFDLLADEFVKLNIPFNSTDTWKYKDDYIDELRENTRMNVPDFKHSVYLVNGFKEYMKYLVSIYPINKIMDMQFTLKRYPSELCDCIRSQYVKIDNIKSDSFRTYMKLPICSDDELKYIKLYFRVYAYNYDDIFWIHYYTKSGKINGYFKVVIYSNMVFDISYARKRMEKVFFFSKYQLKEINQWMNNMNPKYNKRNYQLLFDEWVKLNPWIKNTEDLFYYHDFSRLILPDFENSLFLKYGKFIYR